MALVYIMLPYENNATVLDAPATDVLQNGLYFYYLYLKLHMSLNFKTFNYCLYKTTETKLLFRTVQTVMGSKVFTLSLPFCHLCISVCMLMMRVSIDMSYVCYNNLCSNCPLLIKLRVLYNNEGRLPTQY